MLLLLVAAQFAFVGALVGDRCPKNWKHWKKGRACYHVSNKKLSHYDAQSYCGKLSGRATLLRIESDAENDFVSDLDTDFPIWLDAKARFDIVDSAAGLFSPGYVLRWPNNRPVRYSNFAKGNTIRRLTARNGCVTVNSRGEWLNSECSSSTKAYAVCERKAIMQPKKAGCARHWHLNRETKSCYRAVVRDNMTMLTADIACYELGAVIEHEAMLASIGSAAENDYILNFARQALPDFEFVLLGAFGNANDKTQWTWLDGSIFANYQNWERGMPHGARHLAVLIMNYRGKWLNHYADKVLSYYRSVAVCKYKL